MFRSRKTEGFKTERGRSVEDSSLKDSFISMKLKESINSKLDNWKHRKILNKSLLENDSTQSHSSSPFSQKKPVLFKKFKRQSGSIEDSVQSTSSNLEKIFEIFLSISNSLVELNSPFHSFFKQNLARAAELIDDTMSNSNNLIEFLNDSTQRHRSEVLNLKRSLEAQYEGELRKVCQENEDLKEIIESQTLTEPRVLEELNIRIESLGALLTESDRQVLEKIDELNEKSKEITSLKDYIATLTADLDKVKEDTKELEKILKYQQESYQGQIKELNRKLEILSREIEKNKASQKDLKSSAESYKNQFSKAVEALSRADEQLESLKLSFFDKENHLKQEVLTLANRNKILDSVVDNLKKDLSIAQDRIEARDFIVNKCKEDEVTQLQNNIGRLNNELNVLYKRNKDLITLNQKLEDRLTRAVNEKSHLIKPDKKKVNNIKY